MSDDDAFDLTGGVQVDEDVGNLSGFTPSPEPDVSHTWATIVTHEPL